MVAKWAAGALAALLALVVVGYLLLSGDGGQQQPSPGDGRQVTPSADVPPADVSPFTGMQAKRGPVLTVKVDNVRAARPQTGLDKADIVYVERVEAGLTRILAVYSAQLPPVVGPVRSARESDLELLRQFGRPALAYSGVQNKLRPAIEAAPLYALPSERVPDSYFRSRDRTAPHNLYLRPERALRAAPDASRAKDIGFRFGAAPSGGRPVSEHAVSHPQAKLSFSWSKQRKRWLVSMDGTAARTAGGGRLEAAKVVIQRVEIRPSRFHDRSGSVSPYTETTGSGTALILRDGRRHDARWSRPSPTAGTEFTAPGGERMTFAPGQLWVVYVPR